MATQAGFVKQIDIGKFYVKHQNGFIKEIKKGDVIFEGDTVYGDKVNSGNARLQLELESKEIVVLSHGQKVLFDSSTIELTHANDELFFTNESVAKHMQELATAHQDITDEETAAGQEVAESSDNGVFVYAQRDGNEADVRSTLNDNETFKNGFVEHTLNNESIVNNNSIIVDTTPPVVNITDITIVDTNNPADGKADEVTIKVTSDEPNAPIVITDKDGNTLATGTTDNNGSFQTTITTDKVQSGDDITATITDKAGNSGSDTDKAGSLTYSDNTPPVAPVITNIIDEIGDYSKVTLYGTGEAGATITLYAREGSSTAGNATSLGDYKAVVANIVVGSDGKWSADISNLPDTPINDNEFFYAIQTDKAGNTSVNSNTVQYWHGDWSNISTEYDDDFAFAGNGDDRFVVSNVNDANDYSVIDGGNGTDIAVFSKKYSDYGISKNSSNDVLVTNKDTSTDSNGDGIGDVVELRRIEKVEFSDGVYDTTTGMFTPFKLSPTSEVSVVEGEIATIKVDVIQSSMAKTYDFVIGKVEDSAKSSDYSTIAFTNGVSYNSTTKKITIPANVTSFEIKVTTVDDTDIENYETLTLVVDGSDSVITIKDNDHAPKFDSSSYSVKVYEDDLLAGSKVSTYSGKVNVSDEDGGVLMLKLVAPTDSIKSGSENIVWYLSSDGHTLIGRAGSEEALKITLDDDGNYKVDLYKPLNHANGDGKNSLLLDVGIEVVDADGHKTESKIVVDIVDSIPVANSSEISLDIPVSNIKISGYEAGFTNIVSTNCGTSGIAQVETNDGDSYKDKLTWGSNKTGYEFVDNQDLRVESPASASSTVLLGTFTHNNFATSGASLKSTDLVVEFDIVIDGKTQHIKHTIKLEHNETPNTYGNDDPRSDDIITINNSSLSEIIKVGDREFVFKIDGFKDQNGDVLTQIRTKEEKSNTFELYATLKSTDNLPLTNGGAALDLSADGSVNSSGVEWLNATKNSDGSYTKVNEYGTFTGYADGTYRFEVSREARDSFKTGESRDMIFNYRVEDIDGDVAESFAKITLNAKEVVPQITNPNDADHKPIVLVKDQKLLGLIGLEATNLIDLDKQAIRVYDKHNDITSVTISNSSLFSLNLSGKPFSVSQKLAEELGLKITTKSGGLLGLILPSYSLTITKADGGSIDNETINELLGTLRFNNTLLGLGAVNVLEQTTIRVTDSNGDTDSKSIFSLVDIDLLNNSYNNSGYDNVIEGDSSTNTLTGGDGDDRIYGYDKDDTISGGKGNDFIRGGKGNDTIDGGDGNDTLIGGVGADKLNGGNGDDILVTDFHTTDTAKASNVDTKVDGGNGKDTLILEGNNGIDFSKLINASQNPIKNIEVIDLAKGDHKLENIKLSDIINMTDANKELIILGDNKDSVTFKDEANKTWSKSAGVGADSGFDIYTNSGDSTLKVKVEHDISHI